MSRHERGKLLSANHRLSRHAMCKVPINNRPKVTILSKTVPSSATGIIGQVKKVSNDISELQKNLAAESASRNDLQMHVEQLKAETAEAKQYMYESMKDGVKRRSNGKVTIILLMKKMPCKSLVELDWLLDFIETRITQWCEYLKLLGGNDFNSAIKNIINTIMDRSLQKQLSWTGLNTTKPSLKTHYKLIVDGIHLTMKDNFKDYTLLLGEMKMHSMLKNAAKCRA